MGVDNNVHTFTGGGNKVVPSLDTEGQELLVKEAWITDDHIFLRHPLVRICFTWLIIGVDFFIFAEDPIQDSLSECSLPFVGNIVTMVVFTPYAPVGFMVLRIILIVLSFIFGVIVGTMLLHHWLLRGKCKLRMFTDYRGSVLCNILCICIGLYVSSLLYNAIDSNEENHTGANMGISNRQFGKLAQCGTWLGDIITVVMVFDSIFQDRTYYPNWCPKAKHTYTTLCNGTFRVLVVWVFFFGSTAAMFVSIFSVGDEGSRWPGHTNELTRIAVVNVVTIVDLIIVFGDWSFPTFVDQEMDDGGTQPAILIAGSFNTDFKCHCLQVFMEKCMSCCNAIPCIRKLTEADYWKFTVTSKWLNYGPLLVILGLDMNMLKNQIIYEPVNFGQYTDGDGAIWTITDTDYLDLHYVNGLVTNASAISWAARQGHNSSGSDFISSYYGETDILYKGMFAIPCLLCLFCFIVITVVGNRHYVQDGDKWYTRRAAVRLHRQQSLVAEQKENKQEEKAQPEEQILKEEEKEPALNIFKEEEKKPVLKKAQPKNKESKEKET